MSAATCAWSEAMRVARCSAVKVELAGVEAGVVMGVVETPPPDTGEPLPPPPPPPPPPLLAGLYVAGSVEAKAPTHVLPGVTVSVTVELAISLSSDCEAPQLSVEMFWPCAFVTSESLSVDTMSMDEPESSVTEKLLVSTLMDATVAAVPETFKELLPMVKTTSVVRLTSSNAARAVPGTPATSKAIAHPPTSASNGEILCFFIVIFFFLPRRSRASRDCGQVRFVAGNDYRTYEAMRAAVQV